MLHWAYITLVLVPLMFVFSMATIFALGSFRRRRPEGRPVRSPQLFDALSALGRRRARRAARSASDAPHIVVSGGLGDDPWTGEALWVDPVRPPDAGTHEPGDGPRPTLSVVVGGESGTPRVEHVAVPILGAGLKRCPDCAEAVLTAARVCKHCGFRFQSPEGTQRPYTEDDREIA